MLQQAVYYEQKLYHFDIHYNVPRYTVYDYYDVYQNDKYMYIFNQ